MENEENEEAKRKKAEEIMEDLLPLAEDAISTTITELVFRNFLIKRLRDIAQEFYGDMLLHLESEGYEELESATINAGCNIAMLIHEAIWDNQIGDKYKLDLYRFCLQEAPKYNLKIKDYIFDDDEDEEEDDDD